MSFTWESQLAAILKQNRLQDFVGTFNCEVFGSLSVSQVEVYCQRELRESIPYENGASLICCYCCFVVK